MGGRLYIAVREGCHCIGTGGTAGADAAEDMGAAPAVLRGGTERGILPGMSIPADEAGKWHDRTGVPHKRFRRKTGTENMIYLKKR